MGKVNRQRLTGKLVLHSDLPAKKKKNSQCKKDCLDIYKTNMEPYTKRAPCLPQTDLLY